MRTVINIAYVDGRIVDLITSYEQPLQVTLWNDGGISVEDVRLSDFDARELAKLILEHTGE